MTTATITTRVACHRCARSGHATRFSSATHSRTNWISPREPPDTSRSEADARAARRAAASERGVCAGWSPAAVSSSIATSCLPGLPVRRVLAAGRAELRELHPIGRVALGLLGLVVASLAVGAGERHRDPDTWL